MRGLVRFLMWTVILLGTLVAVLRLTAIRWIRLPTNDPVFEASVQPSLEGGDLVLLLRLGEPSYGDLVVCPEPDYPERYVIGRIVGEPGDEVRFKNGRLMVNGKKFVSERNCEPPFVHYPHPDNPEVEIEQVCEMENLSGHLHRMGEIGNHKIPPEDQSVLVTDGHYFLASDNRLFPYDSRQFGLVPKESCQEWVVFRIVSRKGWAHSERRLNFIQ